MRVYDIVSSLQKYKGQRNCCLFDTKAVMTGGFEMGNLWYNEPKTIDTACDVLGDIIMMSASMQYGL